MGMYTEVRVNLTLRKDAPYEVVKMVKALANATEVHPRSAFSPLPDHPFFKTDRWPFLFCGSSAYFDEDPHAEVVETEEGFKVTAVANLKNYCGEIEKFADWVHTHCAPQSEPIVTAEYEECRGSLSRYF